MKMNYWLVTLVLLATLVFVSVSRAQKVEERELSISRDFGSSSGTGDIQGTFSMKVNGPANLERVQFFIDNTMIAENYTPGMHTMYAAG